MNFLRSFPVIPVLALMLAGCGGPPPARTAPQPESSAEARARADSLRRPYTEADVRFMSDMIAHHGQALVMAGWAPSHEAGHSVRILAERIVNAQQDEIATMQQWLRDRDQPVPQPGAHGHGHAMLMPGMLTDEQMGQLDQAKGPEFDRLFLGFMIQHHRGAVTMVDSLIATPGAARDETTFKLANDISVDQSTEIARMETMLATPAPETHTQ
jgi:uncharacterized protein (DUF305 family)